MTISTQLGEPLDTVVDGLVKAGRYRSRHEVLREGIRLVEEQELRRGARDAAVARGIADAENGRVAPLDEVEARLTARYRALADARGG